MLFFRNDYGEGAHPDVLAALNRTNHESTAGYGEDIYCFEAREKIKGAANCPGAQVFFVAGGTQANLLMISSILRPHEAVLSADTGHINVHETGAIEATGHKVLTVPGKDGKVDASALERELLRHGDCHMVKPRLLYISNATELGTVYTKSELCALREFSDDNGLFLYIDGARLAAALSSPASDVTLSDIARCADVFSIGGTKNGALFGEALVIVNPALQEDFPYLVKQRGAMLAKGRLLGVQFSALFEGDLLLKIGAHENKMAARLAFGLQNLGFRFIADSPTNQIFPVLTNEQADKLREYCAFEIIERREKDMVVRFVTSWATEEKQVDRLIEVMETL